MEQMAKKTKRVLKNITFEENDDSHIALVHKKQGGAASGANYKLILKGREFSEDFIEKASKIKVTLPIEEFLSRFFGMMESQSEVLARALGFKTVAMDKQELDAKEDMLEAKEQEIDPEMPEESEGSEYEDWIQSQLESFEVMKNLLSAEDVASTLSTIDEYDCLSLLKDQALLEKAFRKITRAEKSLGKVSNPVEYSAEDGVPQNAIVGDNVEVSASEIQKKENNMTNDAQVIEQQVEVISKAEFDQIAKAFAEQKEQLEKALESVAQFQAEKKDAIAKARKQELTAAVKQADVAEVLFKAVKDAADEDFAAVVKALADMQAVVEKSAMFEEQGASVQEGQEVVQESAVERLLKAKFQTK